MKALPIYDHTVPVACSATGGDLADRSLAIARLREAATSVERTEHGLRVRFPAGAELEAELRTFVLEEKGCCPFWGFDLDVATDGITLRWDAPPEARELLDRLLG